MARLIFNDWLSAWDERLFLAVACRGKGAELSRALARL